MTKPSIFALTSILICTLFSTAQAQTPSIEVTTDRERAQFAIQGQAQSVRVEVFAPSGELIFEAEELNAQSIDWQMTNDKGERVADGVYLATITVTDQAGRRRKRIEQIMVTSLTEEKQALSNDSQVNQAVGNDSPTVNAVSNISGQGTAGKIAKFTGANAIGNSIMTEYLNRVGINAGSPTATLMLNAIQPLPLATNGTPAIPLFQIIGGKGGNTTVGGGRVAGAGASISLAAGSGGDAPAGSRRGNGGNITLQPGSTGAGAGTAGLNGNVLIAPTGVGNVAIGTSTATSRLTVNGGVEILGAGNGIKFPDGSLQTKAGGAITGAGTVNQLLKFTSATSFGNAAITENGGNVGIGTTSPTLRLTVNGGIQILGAGNGIRFADGSIQTKAIAGTINGTGTTGQIAKFTGPNSFGNSAIREVSGNVGIGTATPKARLSIIGGPAWTANGWIGSVELSKGSAIGWRPNSSAISYGIGQSDGGLYFFRTESSPGTTNLGVIYDMAITDSGSVGINTTTPNATLDVNGSLNTAGNIGQSASSYGGVKAMLRFQGNGQFVVCYNGVSRVSSSSSPAFCGFAITPIGGGVYNISFGSAVNDSQFRFFSLSGSASIILTTYPDRQSIQVAVGNATVGYVYYVIVF